MTPAALAEADTVIATVIEPALATAGSFRTEVELDTYEPGLVAAVRARLAQRGMSLESADRMSRGGSETFVLTDPSKLAGSAEGREADALIEGTLLPALEASGTYRTEVELDTHDKGALAALELRLAARGLRLESAQFVSRGWMETFALVDPSRVAHSPEGREADAFIDSTVVPALESSGSFRTVISLDTHPETGNVDALKHRLEARGMSLFKDESGGIVRGWEQDFAVVDPSRVASSRLGQEALALYESTLAPALQSGGPPPQVELSSRDDERKQAFAHVLGAKGFRLELDEGLLTGWTNLYNVVPLNASSES